MSFYLFKHFSFGSKLYYIFKRRVSIIFWYFCKGMTYIAGRIDIGLKNKFVTPVNSFYHFFIFQHHELFHPSLNRREYSCKMKSANSNVTDCKGHYQDFQVLKAHYSYKHNAAFEYPLKCEVCNISFILEEALLHHERTEHSSKISIELCVDCDIDFFSIATKLVHEDMYHRYGNMNIGEFRSGVEEQKIFASM